MVKKSPTPPRFRMSNIATQAWLGDETVPVMELEAEGTQRRRRVSPGRRARSPGRRSRSPGRRSRSPTKRL